MDKPAQKVASKKVMVTCYDATFAKICADAITFDYLLVGDSLGTVISGESSTTHVGMAEMLHHCKAVAKGLQASKISEKPLLIGDMPIHSYATEEVALKNALLLKDAGCQMVKVEGPVYEIVAALVKKGIRVCGHIGLTPQSIRDYKVQGKTEAEAERLFQEAIHLEKSGCEILVLEMIPSGLAEKITKALKIPTIGIGAGPACDGQVLVLYDLLGLNPEFQPKFLKKYADGYDWVSKALKNYANDVRNLEYPDGSHSFK